MDRDIIYAAQHVGDSAMSMNEPRTPYEQERLLQGKTTSSPIEISCFPFGMLFWIVLGLIPIGVLVVIVLLIQRLWR